MPLRRGFSDGCTGRLPRGQCYLTSKATPARPVRLKHGDFLGFPLKAGHSGTGVNQRSVNTSALVDWHERSMYLSGQCDERRVPSTTAWNRAPQHGNKQGMKEPKSIKKLVPTKWEQTLHVSLPSVGSMEEIHRNTKVQ